MGGNYKISFCSKIENLILLLQLSRDGLYCTETVHTKHWSNGSLKEAYRVSRPKQTALIADTMEKVTEIKNS